jgi:hypothetical protein
LKLGVKLKSEITRMSGPQREPLRTAKRCTKSHSKGKLPVRSAKTARIKNVFPTPSLNKLGGNILLTLCTFASKVLFEMSDPRHTSKDSVLPSQLTNLGKSERFLSKYNVTSNTPDAPHGSNSQDVPGNKRCLTMGGIAFQTVSAKLNT